MPNLPQAQHYVLQEIAGRTDEQFRLMAPFQLAAEARGLATQLLALLPPPPVAKKPKGEGRSTWGTGGPRCQVCGESAKGTPGKFLCAGHWAKVPGRLALELRPMCKPGKPPARKAELVKEILETFRK